MWFALTALAGHDVVDVVTSSDLDECRAAVGPDGSVLHPLRVPTGTWPAIMVTTRDGRHLPVHRDKRSYNESSGPDGT
jgi:Ser/Thr protein kinase RdoA (MazF antagonist)